MYPIPDHLKAIFTPIGDDNSESRVTGMIHCKCSHPLFTPYVNDAGTIAAVKCRSCGAKAILFHAGRHGWDGFVANADYLYDLPTKMHAVEKCEDCKTETAFGVKVIITNCGREDFIENSELEDENGKKLREEDWVNAFASFRMDLVCPVCAKVTESVIDIETA